MRSAVLGIYFRGSPTLYPYTRLIEPIGHRAKERNEDFYKQYAKVVNLFAEKFMKQFCDDGEINWTRLVEFNSAK